MHGRVCAWWGMHGGGVCMAGAYVTGSMHGMHSKGACMAGEMATAADGTHPTGMLSFRFL